MALAKPEADVNLLWLGCSVGCHKAAEQTNALTETVKWAEFGSGPSHRIITTKH